jgi:hypothetical protein
MIWLSQSLSGEGHEKILIAAILSKKASSSAFAFNEVEK